MLSGALVQLCSAFNDNHTGIVTLSVLSADAPKFLLHDLLGLDGCLFDGLFQVHNVLRWLSRLFLPLSVAEHGSQLKLEGYFRGDYGLILCACPLNERVHDVGWVRLHHSNVPIVALIVDEQVAFCINTDHLRGLEKVLALWSIFEPILAAYPGKSIHVLLLNLDSSHAVIVFVSDVGNSGVDLRVVGEILLLRGQLREGYVLDPAEVDSLPVNHLVHVGAHLIALVLNLGVGFI